jgi:hypothetical protein
MTGMLSGLTLPVLIDALPADQQQGLIAILPPEYHKKSAILPLFSAGKKLGIPWIELGELGRNMDAVKMV